jgi:hypothetical protein
VALLINFELHCDKPAIHAVKTVSTTAAELFSGASRLIGRKRMRVTNEGALAIYFGIGDPTITAGITGTGQPIQPGEDYMFYFDPETSMPIYFISTSSNANIKVSEM